MTYVKKIKVIFCIGLPYSGKTTAIKIIQEQIDSEYLVLNDVGLFYSIFESEKSISSFFRSKNKVLSSKLKSELKNKDLYRIFRNIRKMICFFSNTNRAFAPKYSIKTRFGFLVKNSNLWKFISIAFYNIIIKSKSKNIIVEFSRGNYGENHNAYEFFFSLFNSSDLDFEPLVVYMETDRSLISQRIIERRKQGGKTVSVAELNSTYLGDGFIEECKLTKENNKLYYYSQNHVFKVLNIKNSSDTNALKSQLSSFFNNFSL